MRGLSKNILVFGRFDKKKKNAGAGGKQKVYVHAAMHVYFHGSVERGSESI